MATYALVHGAGDVDRLGIEPDELPSGHTPALSHPRELVELMESYRGG